MASSFLSPSATQVLYLNLDVTDATQVARFLTRHPSPVGHFISVNCQQVRGFKEQGVCHVISQLLLLRAAGSHVCLHHVGRTFHRALRLLQLTPLFEVRRHSRLPAQPRSCPN
jgi:hypothetical protein